MKHLRGALLALTVAPIAVVFAPPVAASAATPASCASNQAAVSAQGSTGTGQTVLSASSQQKVCVARPGVAAGRVTAAARVTDDVHAGVDQHLAVEIGSDAGSDTPRSETPQDPAPGSDPDVPPPADATDPESPGCADGSDATCDGSNSVSAEPGESDPADVADPGTENSAPEAPAGSDPWALPHTGAAAATALTLGLGATGVGLVLLGASRRRKAS